MGPLLRACAVSLACLLGVAAETEQLMMVSRMDVLIGRFSWVMKESWPMGPDGGAFEPWDDGAPAFVFHGGLTPPSDVDSAFYSCCAGFYKSTGSCEACPAGTYQQLEHSEVKLLRAHQKSFRNSVYPAAPHAKGDARGGADPPADPTIAAELLRRVANEEERQTSLRDDAAAASTGFQEFSWKTGAPSSAKATARRRANPPTPKARPSASFNLEGEEQPGPRRLRRHQAPSSGQAPRAVAPSASAGRKASSSSSAPLRTTIAGTPDLRPSPNSGHSRPAQIRKRVLRPAAAA